MKAKYLGRKEKPRDKRSDHGKDGQTPETRRLLAPIKLVKTGK